VVCAVGKKTLREQELKTNELRFEEEVTPLQAQLEKLGAQIGKWAYLMASLTLVCFTIFWFINTVAQDYQIISYEAL
jgi:hypothetical protein